MAANFPNSPSNGQTFTSNGVTFTWDGSAWKQSASPGVKGTKGEVQNYIQELVRDNEDVLDYFEYKSKDYYYFLHGPLWKESI